MITLSRCAVALAIAGPASGLLADVPPPQNFVLFQSFVPGAPSFAHAVSSNGYASAVQQSSVVRFVPGAGFQNLGPPFGNNNVSDAGVNSSGTVVGGAFGSGPRIAFRYDDGGGYSVVATGNSSAAAYAISDSGFITGETDSHAFTYSPQGGLVTIGNATQVGYAVNESGQVTGFGDPGPVDRAFLYTPGSGVLYLSPPGASRSYGRGINNQGQVVLDVLDNSLSTVGAYVYTPGQGYALLPQTANVPLAMHDINNLGWVVGNLSSRGTLWLPGQSTPVSLTAYIQTYFGGSYVVDNAYAVNDLGQIVGSVHDAAGHSSGFILTIPSPAPLAAFGLAGLACARRRRT